MMDWYRFNVAEYTRLTRELPDAEDLALRRMIDLYYLREGPLPLDHNEIEQLVRLDWDCIEPVLREFFHATTKGYKNDALQSDVDRRLSRTTINKASGKKGGRPKKVDKV
jgi:uncharacterized protein YdaU (DUF1376 family)